MYCSPNSNNNKRTSLIHGNRIHCDCITALLQIFMHAMYNKTMTGGGMVVLPISIGHIMLPR